MSDGTRADWGFGTDPDWRFPLRLGLPPNAEALMFGDGVFASLGPPVKSLVARVDLAVDGLECDIVLVRSQRELEALASSVTVSANLVLLLDEAADNVEQGSVHAAVKAVGAFAYAAAPGPAGERLWSFLYELSHRATIEEALVGGGPFQAEGNPTVMNVPPVAAFLEQVATIDAADTPRTEDRPEPTREPEPYVRRRGRTRGGAARGRTGDDHKRSRSAVRSRFEVVVTTEMGSGQAASDLGIEVGERVFAGDLARRLTADDTDQYFHHETDGATIAAGLGRDEAVAEELDKRADIPARRSRFLQAALHRGQQDGTVGARVEHGFLDGEPMVLLVGIGPVGPTRLVSNIPLDETQLGEPGPDGWDLEITLKPDVGEVQRHRLGLPRTGSSTDVSFAIEVDPTADHWRGRITVWHRLRAIQSAILSGPVIATDADPGTGQRPSLVIDGEFHPLVGLDAHTRGGATIELDERPAVYVGSADWLVEPRDKEVLAASKRIARKLGEMAVELDEAADLNDERSHRFLEYAAAQGSLLLDALFPDEEQRNALRGEPFLQALRLSPSAPELPYEFLYDLPSPPPKPQICTEWVDGVDAGRCPRCHAPGADNRDVLCPLGFWGLRKVIERHTAVGDGATRALARLRRGEVPGKTPIELRRAAFALSDKADREPRGAPADYIVPSDRIQSALAAANLPFDGPIATWEQWQNAIEDSKPDLLIILGHAKFDRRRDEWTMRIGKGSDLHVGRVFTEHVDVPPELPGPVVFLFGCLTASEGSEQATFARKFRERNASVVIGTTSTVLGRQSGPVAAGLVDAIKQLGPSTSVGELLRRARAAGLEKGSVMAIALNAFGDADYQITISGARPC